MSTAHTSKSGGAPRSAWWPSLGPFRRGGGAVRRIRRHDLTYILTNLATLVENGVSLSKSLATLNQERSLRKHRALLEMVRRRIETGESFSGALARFPETFGPVIVNQVKVAERSGTLGPTLSRLAVQLERSGQVRAQAIRKLIYPLALVACGLIVVTFMLLFVVPVFQKTYDEARVPLPWITRALISAGEIASRYGWIIPVTIAAVCLQWKTLRSNATIARTMDITLLRLPLVGDWARELAVLEFMDVFGDLLESGFTVVDALRVAAGTSRNYVMRQCVAGLEQAVRRGERFSRELDRHATVFPPVVTQLVVVGESTGKLAESTSYIREHLRREIERHTSILVGAIEPILTIGLAAIIGCVVLAIYLPMFDMLAAVKG